MTLNNYVNLRKTTKIEIYSLRKAELADRSGIFGLEQNKTSPSEANEKLVFRKNDDAIGAAAAEKNE